MKLIYFPPSLQTCVEWLAFATCFAAFLLSLAVRRTPTINEPPVINMGRNIATGMWFCWSIYMFAFAQFDDRPLSVFFLILVIVTAFSGLLINAARLFASDMKDPCKECPYKVEPPK